METSFGPISKSNVLRPLGTAFGGITDIETGPDGFLYLLTVDRESDGEGKIYRISLSQ